MPHYAKIENGIVVEVISADANFVSTQEGQWIQTSYNTRGGQHYDPLTGEQDGQPALRKNFAGKGFTYDAERDAFIPPQPYKDWVLNEFECLWYPPVERPKDGKKYLWDENAHEWYIPEKDENGNWIFRS